MKIEQTARIENWSIVSSADTYKAPERIQQYLVGDVYGHPLQPDAKSIQTSHVVFLDIPGKVARTRHTEYRLGEMDNGYKTFLEESKR